MGFGDVVSQTIFFIAILGISVTLIMLFNNYVSSASASIESSRSRMVDQMSTHFDITNVYHENNTNTTHVYVLNTGESKIMPEDMDAYINSRFVPRTEINASVVPSTDVRDEGIWNPGETMYMYINMSLEDEIHSIDVVAPNGVSDSDVFSFS